MTSAHAKSLVLGRIRDILRERPVAASEEHRSIARDYRQSATLDDAARIELFIERLAHYEVGVYRAEPATLRRTALDVVTSRGKRELIAPAGLPREWMPPEIALVNDVSLTHDALDRSEGVVTGCTVAIAETGTLVLTHGPAEGRRAITLLPDYHLCVVFAAQVVQTVPEAFRQLASSRAGLLTTISGPSATADIEMTRIKGVHGPRTLDVILVGPA